MANGEQKKGFYIEKLGDILSPRGQGFYDSEPRDIVSKVRSLIIDRPARFVELQTQIKNFFTNSKQTPEEKNVESDLSAVFSALSKNNKFIHEEKPYNDVEYWTQSTDEKKPNFNTYFQDTFDSTQCDVSIMLSRDPKLSKATSNTEPVELFLNYMPPYVVNQLVPYLEVEFRINKSSQSQNDMSYLNTPSILRFLLGSINTKDEKYGLTDADYSILQQSGQEVTKKVTKFASGSASGSDNNTSSVEVFSKDNIFGMELFLSPQSLTNLFDGDNSQNNRLIPAKPFLPFASITDFEVTLQNAGAGAMCTKTGKLSLKIHDKSRISEISDFLRGPVGYASARIWTSFGWIAPVRADLAGVEDSPEADSYFRMINEKMHLTCCWQVKNTQFSFDQSGAVSLNLDLVSYGVLPGKQTSIRARDGSTEQVLRNFKALMEQLAEDSKDLQSQGIGNDVRLIQVINSGARGEVLPTDIAGGDPDKFINQLIDAYRKTGRIDATKADEIAKRMRSALNPGNIRKDLATARRDDIQKIIGGCLRGVDPFLPKGIVKPVVTPVEPPAQTKPAPQGPTYNISETEKVVNGVRYVYKTQGKKGKVWVPSGRVGPQNNQKKKDEPVKEQPAPQPDSLDSDKWFNYRLKREIALFQPAATEKKEEQPQKDENKGETPQKEGESNGATKTTSGSDGKPAVPRVDIPAPSIRVVSFGKLFSSIVLPAYLEANPDLKSDPSAEVQTIFYVLNDECGPVSGQSIAEFPIDIERLQYEIDAAMATGNKADLTIQEFMQVVVKSQFRDERAIGYGKSSKKLFQPFNRESPGPAIDDKNPLYETNLAQWQAENPTFSLPEIEMYIETQAVEDVSGRRIHTLLASARNQRQNINTKGMLVRFHIYDKQANPRKLMSKIIEVNGKFEVASFNDDILRKKIKDKELSTTEINTFKQQLKNTQSREDEVSFGESLGIKLRTPGGSNVPISIDRKLFGRGGIRDSLQMLAPTLLIGSNGTTIKSVNLSSKTDDLAAAAYLVNQIKRTNSANNPNTLGPPPTGLEGPGGLPIRMVPATLSMTTMGCPAIELYQQFFIDLGTGTSLDNLYNCNSITHKINAGRFETNLGFLYTDGYGKFQTPTTIQSILANAGASLFKAESDAADAKAKEEEEKKKKEEAKKAGAGRGGVPRGGLTTSLEKKGILPPGTNASLDAIGKALKEASAKAADEKRLREEIAQKQEQLENLNAPKLRPGAVSGGAKRGG